MKKLIIVLIIGAVISPLFAQEKNDSKHNTSDMYYINVPVEKIYPSAKGYIILYRRNTTQLGTIGILNEWFTDAASKAEMLKMPPGKNWPSLTVFYRDGKFSHVRLYVHPAKGHQTWGNLPQSADLSKYFSDSEEIKLEF